MSNSQKKLKLCSFGLAILCVAMIVFMVLSIMHNEPLAAALAAAVGFFDALLGALGIAAANQPVRAQKLPAIVVLATFVNAAYLLLEISIETSFVGALINIVFTICYSVFVKKVIQENFR